MFAAVRKNSREFLRVYESTKCDREATIEALGCTELEFAQYSLQCGKQMRRLEAERDLDEEISRMAIQKMLWEWAQDEGKELKPEARIKALELLVKMRGFTAPVVTENKHSFSGGVPPDLMAKVEETIFGIVRSN